VPQDYFFKTVYDSFCLTTSRRLVFEATVKLQAINTVRRVKNTTIAVWEHLGYTFIKT